MNSQSKYYSRWHSTHTHTHTHTHTTHTHTQTHTNTHTHTHRAETLVEQVSARWQLPKDRHIIFSPSCPHFITSRKPISDTQFQQLLSQSGGSHGHAKLYVFEMYEQREVAPDVSCLEPLSEWAVMYVSLYIVEPLNVDTPMLIVNH